MITVIQPREKAQLRVAPQGLIITNEAAFHRENPPWLLVAQIVQELDVSRGNSFCCLETLDGSYMQTLHGFIGWHLEWRVYSAMVVGGYTHYRASYHGGSQNPIILKKHDYQSEGEYRDLIQLDDVIDAFRSFYYGDAPPALFDWRAIEI